MKNEIAIARVRREQDNAKVNPVDLLQTVIADIQDGEVQADGVIVVLVHRPENDSWSTESYRCGMTRTDEIAFLSLAQNARIEDWKR